MPVQNVPHILMVEDNHGDVCLVKMMLAQPDANQYRLTNVNNLTKAIRHLCGSEYDVVLLDLDLPDSKWLENIG